MRAEENRRVSEVEPWPIRSARQDPRKQALIMRHASKCGVFLHLGLPGRALALHDILNHLRSVSEAGKPSSRGLQQQQGNACRN